MKNSTTGKPAAGDDVVLLSLGQGMEESGRVKADAKGNFSFKLDDAQSPHLVRAIHEGVTYHRMAPPGTTSVEVEVYDVGKKIDGITVVADIMKVQAEKGQLEIVRAFAVQNTSKPPRTQMSERNMEFYVPEGAQMMGGQAVTEHGQPINSAPVPEGDNKTRYSFIFPLRPGTTQFQVAYQLPYTGSANIDPKSIYPLEHFVAIVPKSMEFSAAPGTSYQSMNNPSQPDSITQVASGTSAGQNLAFKVSGEGSLAEQQEGGAQGESAAAPAGNRPGGGLGPPIDAPDPLQKYRWPILAGFAVVLVAGAVFVAWRQQSAAARGAGRTRAGAKSSARTVAIEDSESDYEFPEAPASVHSQSLPPAKRSSTSMLLEGLKEELFQLEVEHKRGQITQQEYEKTKAALDQTLQHALKREAQKA
ncbi:MAG TPA: hypothetical protein VKR60_09590 [Candidatus Sulfotelmatobacter sp.]|nr:hypothetical protein [Candidatus Sulfotelmatobacter sp.]